MIMNDACMGGLLVSKRTFNEVFKKLRKLSVKYPGSGYEKCFIQGKKRFLLDLGQFKLQSK